MPFRQLLNLDSPPPNVTCHDSTTLKIRGFVAARSMLYEILARVKSKQVNASSPSGVRCIQQPVPSGAPPNATLEVTAGTAQEAWISWVGGTEYSLDSGDAAHGYSFKGPDPHNALVSLISTPDFNNPTFATILAQHVADVTAALSAKFSISLGQTPRLDVPTDVIRSGYQLDVGDKYLEWLLFNYGRYLLVSSSRGVLPANLQGKWGNTLGNPWGAG